MAVTTEYLSGGRIQGRSDDSTSAVPAQTSWKVIDSAVLNSAGDDLDCNGSGSGFGNYDNLMFIFYRNGVGDGRITFNGDDAGSNGNYSRRYAYNSASNSSGTQVSQDKMNVYLNTTSPNFTVFNCRNIDGEVKVITHTGVEVGTDSLSSSVTPNRTNQVVKWSGTNRITRIRIQSDVDMPSGTELIVLGSNDSEADSGSTFWKQLGKQTLDATGDDMTVTLSEQKKYLWVKWFCKQYVSSTTETNTQMKFNGITDMADLVARRIHYSSAGNASDSATANLDYLNFSDGSIGSMTGNAFIYNKSDEIKLIIFFIVKARDGDYQPQTHNGVAKWTITNTAITSIQLHNTGTGAYDIGSSLRVWGGQL